MQRELAFVNVLLRPKKLRLFPIDLEQYDRSEQLKKSGLGKVIMFLSRSDEEINLNRKLVKELVDKWRVEKLCNEVKEIGVGIIDADELASVYDFRIDKFSSGKRLKLFREVRRWWFLLRRVVKRH